VTDPGCPGRPPHSGTPLRESFRWIGDGYRADVRGWWRDPQLLGAAARG
jgi:hypothetical protein